MKKKQDKKDEIRTFPDPFGYQLSYIINPYNSHKELYLTFPKPIAIPFDFFEDLFKKIQKEAKDMKKKENQKVVGLMIPIPAELQKIIKGSTLHGKAVKTKNKKDGK